MFIALIVDECDPDLNRAVIGFDLFVIVPDVWLNVRINRYSRRFTGEHCGIERRSSLPHFLEKLGVVIGFEVVPEKDGILGVVRIHQKE